MISTLSKGLLIGSNIFDITVGLPFPWLLNAAISGEVNSVVSEGLFCSITLVSWHTF